jgi:hypothetical protein
MTIHPDDCRQIKGLIDARLDLHADQHIASQQKRVLISPGCSS